MNILVVEDNEAEQEILKEAFKEARIDHDLHMVKDGIEALEFLRMQGDFHDAPEPDLILLDLNMPKRNGLEILPDIKNNTEWEHIPILVYSNSEYNGDICRCYAMGVNAYLVKPVDFQGFMDLAYVIDVFWFKLVRYCAH